MSQHEWSSFSGFRMAGRRPSPVAAFEPHHRRLAPDPESPFVRTLVVQRPLDDRIVTLRARTLSEIGPWRGHEARAAATSSPRRCLSCSGSRSAARGSSGCGRSPREQHEAFLAALANTGH